MTDAMRSDDMRKGNRRRILGVMRRKANLSRTDIQRETGLSAASVSAITSNLIDEGILVSPRAQRSSGAGRGRPKVALALNSEVAIVGTIIFRHNIVLATVADFNGNSIGEHATEFVTAQATPKEIRTSLETCLKTALNQSGQPSTALKRISVGVQGVINISGSTMIWSPISNQTDLPIKSWLEKAFKAPTHISNDCDMISRALNWRDPVRYGKNFAALLIADGVGMGLFLRGELINGTRSSATEFGHMTYLPGGSLCRCGSHGCIEAYASAYAIHRNAKQEPENELPPALQYPRNIDDIVNAARSGDKNAANAIETAGDAIGTGIANIFALVDPFPIIIVGSGGAAIDLMEPPIRKALSATVAGKQEENIPIDCFTDETPLVREGCMINALLRQDEQIADNGTTPKALT